VAGALTYLESLLEIESLSSEATEHASLVAESKSSHLSVRQIKAIETSVKAAARLSALENKLSAVTSASEWTRLRAHCSTRHAQVHAFIKSVLVSSLRSVCRRLQWPPKLLSQGKDTAPESSQQSVAVRTIPFTHEGLNRTEQGMCFQMLFRLLTELQCSISDTVVPSDSSSSASLLASSTSQLWAVEVLVEPLSEELEVFASRQAAHPEWLFSFGLRLIRSEAHHVGPLLQQCLRALHRLRLDATSALIGGICSCLALQMRKNVCPHLLAPNIERRATGSADNVAASTAALWLNLVDEAISFTDSLAQLTTTTSIGLLCTSCLCCVRELAHQPHWFEYWLSLELGDLKGIYLDQVDDDSCLGLVEDRGILSMERERDPYYEGKTNGEAALLEVVRNALKRFRWLSAEQMKQVHSDLLGPLVQVHINQLRHAAAARESTGLANSEDLAIVARSCRVADSVATRLGLLDDEVLFNDGVVVEELNLGERVAQAGHVPGGADAEQGGTASFGDHVSEYRMLSDCWLNAINASLLRGFDARTQLYRYSFSPLDQVTAISSSLVKNVARLPLSYKRLGVLNRSRRSERAKETESLPSFEERSHTLRIAQAHLKAQLDLLHGELGRASFRKLWKEVAKQTSQMLFHVACSKRLWESSARLKEYVKDMEHHLAVFGHYTSKPRNFCKLLDEACKVLSMEHSAQRALAELVENASPIGGGELAELMRRHDIQLQVPDLEKLLKYCPQ